jgi:hypothetical protein
MWIIKEAIAAYRLVSSSVLIFESTLSALSVAVMMSA